MKNLFRSLVLLGALLLGASPGLASQGSGCLPTTGTLSGLTLVQSINTANKAFITSNSGASAPATDCTGIAQYGQWWLDTGTNALRMFEGTSWPALGYFDTSNHLWLPVVGGGAIPSVASAATTDICSSSARAPTVSVTGTTTITSFGSNCTLGQWKTVIFAGALTLTYNGTSMVLPTGANITTAAGDSALVIATGTGNYRVVSYQRADGTPLVLSSIAANRIVGNNTGGAAAPSALTPTQVTAMLDLATASVKGLAPAWPNNTTTFLRGDGSYATPPTVSAGAPGYAPAYPNNTTTYFRGDGTYASSASLGGRVLLNTLTASASADLQDTTSFTSTYKFYQIEIINLVPTTNATEIQLQIHSGGSFKTSGYIGVTSGVLSSPGGLVARNVTTFIPLSGAANDTANSAPGVSGTLRFADPSASAKCVVIGQLIQKYSASNNFYNLQTTGYWDTAAAVTGFKLIATSGTLASGVVYVYGYN